MNDYSVAEFEGRWYLIETNDMDSDATILGAYDTRHDANAALDAAYDNA